MKGLILPKILDLICQRVIFDTDDFIFIENCFDQNKVFQIEVILFLVQFPVVKVINNQVITWTVENHLSQLWNKSTYGTYFRCCTDIGRWFGLGIRTNFWGSVLMWECIACWCSFLLMRAWCSTCGLCWY